MAPRSVRGQWPGTSASRAAASQGRGLRDVALAQVNVADPGADDRRIPTRLRHPFVDGTARIHSNLILLAMGWKAPPKTAALRRPLSFGAGGREGRIVIVRDAVDEPFNAILPFFEWMIAERPQSLAVRGKHFDAHQLVCRFTSPDFRNDQTAGLTTWISGYFSVWVVCPNVTVPHLLKAEISRKCCEMRARMAPGRCCRELANRVARKSRR